MKEWQIAYHNHSVNIDEEQSASDSQETQFSTASSPTKTTTSLVQQSHNL